MYHCVGNCSEAEKQSQEATKKLRERESKMGDLSNLIKELQEENVELFNKISECKEKDEDKKKEVGLRFNRYQLHRYRSYS